MSEQNLCVITDSTDRTVFDYLEEGKRLVEESRQHWAAMETALFEMRGLVTLTLLYIWLDLRDLAYVAMAISSAYAKLNGL